MSRPRYLFAHRGGRAHGPDNTLATFATALERGATGLETDAWLTADGVVVLDHDGVHRAADRRRTPLAQLRRSELPARIPSLDEVYAACGTGFDLAIDARLPAVGAAVIEVAQRHGALDRLWLVTDKPDHLAEWRALSSEVHLAVSLRLVDRRASVIRRVVGSGAEAMNMRWPWWSRRLAARVRDAGLLVFAYDAQSSYALRRCMRLGTDGVFSDHVRRMLAARGGAD